MMHLQRQQQVLADRFNMDSFVPNFNLRAGGNLDFLDSDEDEADGMQVRPSENQLSVESQQRQEKEFSMNRFHLGNRGGPVYYSNCTINVNPTIVRKVVSKRKRIQIESDSEEVFE